MAQEEVREAVVRELKPSREVVQLEDQPECEEEEAALHDLHSHIYGKAPDSIQIRDRRRTCLIPSANCCLAPASHVSWLYPTDTHTCGASKGCKVRCDGLTRLCTRKAPGAVAFYEAGFCGQREGFLTRKFIFTGFCLASIVLNRNLHTSKTL